MPCAEKLSVAFYLGRRSPTTLFAPPELHMSEQNLIFSRKISPNFRLGVPVLSFVLLDTLLNAWRLHNSFEVRTFWLTVAMVVFLAVDLLLLVAIEFFWQPRKVLFLTASGVKDLRIAPEEIPWREIEKIREEEVPINRAIILDMDPAKLAALELAKSAKWLRSRRRAFAPDDLLVMTADLRANHQELLAIFRRLWAAVQALQTEEVSGP